jgi:hypothetical protein
MENDQMNQTKLSEGVHPDKNGALSFAPLINKEDLNQFKDFSAISLLAQKYQTTRSRIISALIAAQAKQEETLSWPY